MSVKDFLFSEKESCDTIISYHKRQIERIKPTDKDAANKAAEHYMQIEFYKGRKSMALKLLDIIEKKQVTEFR